MSRRNVSVVLLCEDSQQEAFARRFLLGMGWKNRDIDPRKSPAGEGSAEQWVKRRFATELGIFRKRSNLVLIAVIDADTRTVPERLDEFAAACAEKNVPFRLSAEAVALIVPRRNIETWIHFLQNGAPVGEDREYRKLKRARECGPAVQKLVDWCRSGKIPDHKPPSLAAACREFEERIKPSRKSN